MKTTLVSVLAIGAGLLAATAPMLAHHSFAAEFDGAKPVVVTGTVTKVDWVNPHSWIYIDVKGDDGTVVNWGLETGPPNILYRARLAQRQREKGDTITVPRVRGQGRLAHHGAARRLRPRTAEVVRRFTDDNGPKSDNARQTITAVSLSAEVHRKRATAASSSGPARKWKTPPRRS